jgi:hypothetical protein
MTDKNVLRKNSINSQQNNSIIEHELSLKRCKQQDYILLLDKLCSLNETNASYKKSYIDLSKPKNTDLNNELLRLNKTLKNYNKEKLSNIILNYYTEIDQKKLNETQKHNDLIK